MTPLTHHEILELVEPFARSGRHVDLPASDRINRRIRFRPVLHPAAGTGLPALAETLELESLGTGTCRLTRSLAPQGPATAAATATLQTMGSDVAALLATIDAVPLSRHFSLGSGYTVVRHYMAHGNAAGAVAVLHRGLVQLDGLTLTMTVSPVKGVSAEFELAPAAGELPALPQDVLAVLGWDWARLVKKAGGWRSRLRLRGAAAKRTATAEAALLRAAEHLARTLAESPARFHERHLRARWAVVFRRGIPTLTLLSLVALVLGMPHLDVGERPGLALMLYHVPTLLIALSFTLQELPQFELPPLPRRSTADGWWPDIRYQTSTETP